MKKTINNNRREAAARALLLMGAALLVLASCATPRTVVDLSYIPSAPYAGGDAAAFTVTLAKIIDNRAAASERDLGDMDGLALSADEPPALVATRAIASYLMGRGYKVRRLADGWDGSGNVTRPGWSGLLIGGSLLEFRLKVTTTSFKVHYVCTVKLRLFYADARTGRAALEETVEAVSEYRGVRFSPRKAEEVANKALSNAVEKALSGVESRYEEVSKGE